VMISMAAPLSHRMMLQAAVWFAMQMVYNSQ